MLASSGLVQILPKSSLDRRNAPTSRCLPKPTSGAGRFVRHSHRIDSLTMKIRPATSHLERSRDERRKTLPYSCQLATARLRSSQRGVPSPGVRAFEAPAFSEDVGFAEQRPEPPRAPRGLHSRAGNDPRVPSSSSDGSPLPAVRNC